jgi:hypothetical protein
MATFGFGATVRTAAALPPAGVTACVALLLTAGVARGQAPAPAAGNEVILGKPVAEWKKRLADTTPGVADTALVELAKAGRAAAPLAPELIALMRGASAADGRDRLNRAAAALCRVGPAALPAIKDFLAMGAESPLVRRALVGMGPEAAGPVAEAYRAADAKGRKALLPVHARLSGEKAAADIAEAMKSADQALRQEAAKTAIDLAPLGADVIVPAAMEVARQDPPAQGQMFDYVRACGPAAKAAVPELVLMLKGQRPTGGPPMKALPILAAIGPDAAKETLPVLKGELEGAEKTKANVKAVREAGGIRRWLGAFGPDGVAILLKDLDSKDRVRQRDALIGLARSGAAGRPALPKVIALLKAGQTEAVAAIAGIGGAEAAPAVPELVSKLTIVGDPDIVAAAVYALGAIGPAAKSAAPELVAALKSPASSAVPTRAALALLKIGVETEAAAAAALDILKSNDSEKRWFVRTLGALGPAARPALPALELTLDSEDWLVFYEATEAIRRIKG